MPSLLTSLVAEQLGSLFPSFQIHWNTKYRRWEAEINTKQIATYKVPTTATF